MLYIIDLPGILVIGGHSATYSVEIWSAAYPEEGGCVLDDYPRVMDYGPTVNLVSNRLVACRGDTCDIYKEGSWEHLQDTIANRKFHSSATTEDAVLLIGGDSLNSTEWIPMNGSVGYQGPFKVRHGKDHCTMQISENIIVVTGGADAQAYVTQYHLVEGNETPLTPLGQPRWTHACGVYQDADGQQVSERLCNVQCVALITY